MSTIPPPRIRKGTILIVDDTLQNLQMLGTVLKSRGFQVAIANNGEQALQRLEKIKPDLILLDIMMPGMDGFETCRRIKANPNADAIPIIFLTAKNATDDIVKGLEMGAVDYVTKPVNLPELLARVNTHLDLKFSHDQLQQALATIEEVSNERRELLHILCHDLANPVNSIIACLKIIKRKPEFFSDEVRDEMLRASSNSMDIINLVRKMRSLEDQKYVLHIKPISLLEVISEARRTLEIPFQEKQMRLIVDVPIETCVMAEKVSLINSIMNNLLTNALKFSFAESTIKLMTADCGDRIKLHITDTGIGIPEKILNNIFKLDISSSRRGTNGETGTGYGMPLVKKFMEAYGGSIDIESRDINEDPKNHGTTVTLTFKKN